MTVIIPGGRTSPTCVNRRCALANNRGAGAVLTVSKTVIFDSMADF
jgi:hypothetical protein